MSKSMFDGEVFGIVDDKEPKNKRICHYSVVAK